MISIRQILREDYPCKTCGAKRGDYCRVIRRNHPSQIGAETDPHQSRWNQYHEDRRHQFASDIPSKQLAIARNIRLTRDASGPLEPSLIDSLTGVTQPFEPRRDDDVAQWLKRRRDEYDKLDHDWSVLDVLLDDYRLHSDTGIPLAFDVHESDVGG